MSTLRLLLGCLAVFLLAVDAAIAQSNINGSHCPYCDTEYGVFRHGETWTEKDPCVEYICNRGKKLANIKSCPDLDCGGKREILLPGQCCHQCATETPLIIDWSEWSVWGACSESCGGGSRLRTRFCNDSFVTESMDVIIRCSGRTLEEEQCNMHSCPIHGNWSDWTPFGTCSKTCSGGTKHRFRTCTNPKPQHGGRDCEGLEIDSMECNTNPCPIDGVWEDWSEWSSCSVTCGSGTQERTRLCRPPQHGGLDCQGLSKETKNCTEKPCPIDGVWREWSSWSECSLTCGGGERQRSRQCIPPQHNGKECDGPSVATEACNTQPCPVDGVWSKWSNWSQCSVTCNGGIQNRSRTCIPPKYNGTWCKGDSSDTRSCNRNKCPVNGYWTSWSNWTACSVSCDGGTRSRRRQCVPPKFGGDPCEGNNAEVEDCNTHNCPIDGKWSEWSVWSECSVTCGDGTRSRTRTCTPPKFNGKECEGSPNEIRVCLKSACIDACRPNPCFRKVLCLNHPDSLHTYKCGPCPQGMSGNGSHCELVNECAIANPCAEGVACQDIRTGWRCGHCPKGYSGKRINGPDLMSAQNSKQICTDVDECQRKKSCDRNAQCTNTPGGYNCACKPYYKGDGKTCTVDNACELKKHNCGKKEWCNSQGDGKFFCQCPLGFVGDGIICMPDTDLDGIIDKEDNCPDTPNSGQENADGDEEGDACDIDADDDETVDELDNCKFVKNDQKDADYDGIGDACDNCPTWSNKDQKDSDKDGQGDICDNDVDNDGLTLFRDNCPSVYNPDQKDSDRDGKGDACDNCKLVSNIDQRDSDEDGVGNGCDNDKDNDKDGIQDGTPDGGHYSFDNCPTDPNADQLDTDEDGLGDACDEDDDGDGIDDVSDNCPKVNNPLQKDEDCRKDYDADGIPDDMDACPSNKQIQMANFNNYRSIVLAKNLAGSVERDPEWTLTANGSEITQSADNHPAILLGQDRFMDVEFNGTFFVNDQKDNDYAGFVFNYQSNKRFIVVAWKKTNETYGIEKPFTSKAMSGIQIKVVDSQSGPGGKLRNALWKTGDTRNEVRTIWYDENFVGWEYKRAYFWNLKYKADIGCMRLKFFSGSTQVVDTGCVCDKAIIGGKLGVFSFSQANVIWSNIRYSCVAEDQCTSANPLGRTSRR